ncbi:MAG TPA: carboxypeptidase-like regulatory domain-containing protein [Pyrinomonadaceae bacterium]|nr:carboxypeptidase-like regulatory domain-containing protein [Pyrinomonadaceae bacterium]
MTTANPNGRVFWAGLLLILAAFTVSAQEFRGSLAGKITDPNGAVVPGSKVEIKNIETGIVSSAVTGDDGAYSFPLLPPGKYAVTVTKENFNTAVRDGIQVRVADRLTLDVQLEIGVTAMVTTVASGLTLDTGTVNTGTVVTGKQISELPLTEGTAYQLATLAPGIAYTGNPLFTGPTSNGNLAAFRSNGATGANQITLDGSPNYAFDGGVGFSPPSDAVQEFKVQTNTFDAQQGYSAGATVNVAVKSGSNDVHGSAWYFNRDRSRTANNFFGNASKQSRPIRTYHRFGGVFSGPVALPKIYNGTDRTFFLVSYERLKDNIAEPQIFTVPTEAMRRGDFSALIVNRNNIAAAANTVIFNPFSGTQSGNNVVRTSFGCPTSGALPVNSTCNIIPSNLINPVAANLIKYYPLPNITGVGAGTQNNFFSNQLRHQNYRAWLTRIDHRISSSQSIFGKYYHSFNPEDRQDWAGVVNNFPITRGFEYRTNDGGNIDYTNMINSNFVFDIRVSLNRFVQERRPAESFDPATLGFAAASIAAMRGYQYLPRIMIRNLDATRPIRSTLGSTRSDWNEGRVRPFYMGSVQPTLTQVVDNHTLKYGYDFRVVRENFSTDAYKGGQFFFDGTFTAPASNSSSTLRNVFGRDVAAFLLGIPTTGSGGNASQIDNSINYSVQSLYHGIFFQDDWRATRKLTLNLGLRYDIEQGLTERFNRILRGFDFGTPSPIEAQARAAYTTSFNANPANFVVTPANFHVLGGYKFANDDNRNVWEADRSNFQPRVGVSYQLTEKTVLRAGFGIFMAPFQIETPQQIGFAGTTPFVPSNNNGLTFVATLTNPFPNGLSGIQPSFGSSLGLLTGIGLDVAADSAPIVGTLRKNSKFARLVFGIQRELPGHIVVEANFIRATGYDLPVSRNLNVVPRQFAGDNPTTDAAANTFLTGTIPNPFRNLVPGGSPFNTASTITRAQSLLQFPQFTNLWVQEYNGTNRYQSLQLQIDKRFATDVSLTATYTYSNLREKLNYLNLGDTVPEDRISPFDRPHRFTFAGVYELPIGRGRMLGNNMNRVLNAVIGGWQLNGTYEWQSGEPFLLSNNLYFPGDPATITSRLGEGDGQGGKFGIDRSAIDAPGLVTLTGFGIRNVPTTLDNLRNQPFSVANLGLTKNFRWGEGRRIQIRAEALNAFNHPYFGAGMGLNPGTAAAPNAAFGFVTTQRNNPRDIQFGAKFVF